MKNLKVEIKSVESNAPPLFQKDSTGITWNALQNISPVNP